MTTSGTSIAIERTCFEQSSPAVNNKLSPGSANPTASPDSAKTMATMPTYPAVRMRWVALGSTGQVVPVMRSQPERAADAGRRRGVAEQGQAEHLLHRPQRAVVIHVVR